jgi:hypothetical protein
VHRQLGELIAGVKNLEEAFRRSEDKPDASRASVHRRMDDLVDRIGKVEGTVLQVNEDVTEMKPVTDDVRRWRLMEHGNAWRCRHNRCGSWRHLFQPNDLR